MKFESECSRREFLIKVSGAGAAVMLSPIIALATDDPDPRVAKIAADTIGIDMHNHIDVPFAAAEVPGPDIDHVKDGLHRGRNCQGRRQ